jgi:hypothetical protein
MGMHCCEGIDVVVASMHAYDHACGRVLWERLIDSAKELVMKVTAR